MQGEWLPSQTPKPPFHGGRLPATYLGGGPNGQREHLVHDERLPKAGSFVRALQEAFARENTVLAASGHVARKPG